MQIWLNKASMSCDGLCFSEAKCVLKQYFSLSYNECTKDKFLRL